MNTLNIGGTVGDPFYRYKMPKAKITQQRKNGGTTIIENTKDICKSLRREPKDIARYLSKELSLNVITKGGNWTMTGEITPQIIQNCIGNYIDAHVLCERCKLPETTIDSCGVKTCDGCGHTS